MSETVSIHPVSIHIDGASRGNPGDAAYAVVIAPIHGSPIEESGTLGKLTNNVAEYTALVKALAKAKELGYPKVKIHSDSELLVRQMLGEYKVKSLDLQPLFNEAKQLVRSFEDVDFQHVRREYNKRADELCNIALDGEKPKSSNSGTSSKPKSPGKTVGDGAVRDDAIECLRSAKACWARGEQIPTPELVWEQLWSVIEEGGVLRKSG